jgi:hypothetical protein
MPHIFGARGALWSAQAKLALWIQKTKTSNNLNSVRWMGDYRPAPIESGSFAAALQSALRAPQFGKKYAALSFAAPKQAQIGRLT